MLTTAIPDNGV